MSITNGFNKLQISSINAGRLLSLLFLCFSLHACAAVKKHKGKSKSVVHELTVAGIRPENKTETFVRITFLQSARFYKLPKDSNPEYMILLQESERTHKPVLVERVSEESDVIVSVAKPK